MFCFSPFYIQFCFTVVCFFFLKKYFNIYTDFLYVCLCVHACVVCHSLLSGTNFRLKTSWGRLVQMGTKAVSPIGKKLIFESVVKVKVRVRVRVSLQEMNL